MLTAHQLRHPRYLAGKLFRQSRIQSRRTRPTWILTFNLGRRLGHLRTGGRPSPRVAGLVSTLRRDGVVVIPWAEVFGPDEHDLFERLRDHVDRELITRQAEIGASPMAHTDEKSPRPKPSKQFILRLRDETKGFGPEDADPMLDVARHPMLRSVVEHYLGVRSTIAYCNTWLCVPAPQDDGAHQWHRDPEDRHLVKVFIYLDDVGPAQGPFTYAIGSHPDASGRGRSVRPRHRREPRLDDAAMAHVVSPALWRSATGPAGTILIADTAGYHKGPNRTEDRLTFVASYVTGAASY